MRFVVAVILFIIQLQSMAQDYPEKEMIGFGCWSEGRQTKVVKKGMDLIDRRDYNSLRNLLNKKNAAKQFFGVVALSKLDSAGIIALSESEINKIKSIRNSKRRVAFCSGCIVFGDATLKDALSIEEKHTFFRTSEYWINRSLFDN